MLINNSLSNRALNSYGSTINDSMVYNRLISIIEQYNRLAKAKGLPSKKVPIYTNHINEILITRAINTILNDIDELRAIKDGPPLRYGNYSGVFPDTAGTFIIGSWEYTVIDTYGVVSLWVKINDKTITEMPEELPFNVITDSNGNTLEVTSLQGMFYECPNLTSIDLSKFNTSNITSMQSLLFDCTGLTSINLRGVDTSKVTDMTYMFSQIGLTSIDLSNFDISKATDIKNMFRGSTSLTSITFGDDIINLSAKNISGMFYGCTGLTSIDLGKFNTSNVREMASLFNGCTGLTSIDLSNFDTSNVTNMQTMFNNCTALNDIKFGPNFNISGVTNMTNIFNGCTSLNSITLYKVSTNLLTKFPGDITDWYVDGEQLSVAEWDNSWGAGPKIFTRTIA